MTSVLTLYYTVLVDPSLTQTSLYCIQYVPSRAHGNIPIITWQVNMTDVACVVLMEFADCGACVDLATQTGNTRKPRGARAGLVPGPGSFSPLAMTYTCLLLPSSGPQTENARDFVG
jgi:hypothetical protein